MGDGRIALIEVDGEEEEEEERGRERERGGGREERYRGKERRRMGRISLRETGLLFPWSVAMCPLQLVIN